MLYSINKRLLRYNKLIRHSYLTIKFKVPEQQDSQIYFILHAASPTLLANSHYTHFHIYGTNGPVWLQLMDLEHKSSAKWKINSLMLTIAPLNAQMFIVLTVAQSKYYNYNEIKYISLFNWFLLHHAVLGILISLYFYIDIVMSWLYRLHHQWFYHSLSCVLR